MSDQFYYRQQRGKPQAKTKTGARKLKKDWIAEITEVLGKEVVGLDKCTMKTLEDLLGAIKDAIT
jgi:hypothetical protein